MTDTKASLGGSAASSVKHTPGPWRWRSGTGEDYAALVSDVIGGPIIQTTHDVDPANPTAKLIAAAPLLADTLERVAKLFAALVVYTRERKSPKDTAIMIEWLDEARAALRVAGRLAEDAAEPQKSVP